MQFNTFISYYCLTDEKRVRTAMTCRAVAVADSYWLSLTMGRKSPGTRSMLIRTLERDSGAGGLAWKGAYPPGLYGHA